jgi:hypothetical protein
MQKEAAASYQRMRYGLTTALMGDGLFWFDTRLEDQGVWWYDEFGAPAGDSASLPPPGYLGWPTGEPRLAAEQLDTPDQVINGGFEKGLTNWRWWVDSTTGAGASITVEPTGGISGTTGAHIAVARPAKRWSVLLWQPGISTVAGQSYTLSFWARSDTPRTVYARVRQENPPETDYGFRGQVTVTPQWQWFHLWDTATVTAADGEIALQLGEDSGDLWLDAIQFQEGALGVWARPFQNGLAIVNPTMAVQKVPLDRAYCKLNGNQAPLFQARVDDDAASTSTGWVELPANTEQFGKTVKVANGGTGVSATYVPSLAYEGRYEILAWVVPKSTQSDAVSVTIHHAHGESVTMLDQTSGESGWHSLGIYDFNAGEIGSATLKATGTGTVVADAFKWVHTARYNDGSHVTQVTQQPQDGIVLLTRCYAPDPASQPTDVNKRQHSGAQ